MRALGKIKIEWSPNFAYAIGLIATDGCLYNDGRHINFTSKDEELVLSFKECLGATNAIGRKSRGGCSDKRYFQIQLGDKIFHEYLGSIGLTPKKSKTIRQVKIPDYLFFHFFRGCIDGDGTIGTNVHSESKHRQLRMRLVSASRPFLAWTLNKIRRLAPEVSGGWISDKTAKNVYNLSFGKADSISLFLRMYRPEPQNFLRRKYELAVKWMGE